MNVGTLVNVRENQVVCEGQGPGSCDEKLGWIMETFSREDAIENNLNHNEWALASLLINWRDLPNDYHESYDDLPNFHKVMLESGRYGWVEDHWLEEV